MSATEFDHLPRYLRPKLRLYLSADLVGSTAFKQAPRFPILIDSTKPDTPAGPQWLSEITNFYADLSAEFSGGWIEFCAAARKAPTWPTGAAPEFWKGIGDEVVYVKDLGDPKEVAGTVWAWMSALRRYRAKLRSKQSTLDVKSTVWIAGFPLNNSEVVFDLELDKTKPFVPTDDARLSHFQQLADFYKQKSRQGRYIRDFIGPSIDTGFRLATKSTPRRMTAAIEVVLMIASEDFPKIHNKARSTSVPKFGKIDIYFDGYESLKGILGGKPYPIFWIDIFRDTDDHQLTSIEDKFVQRSPAISPDLEAFCTAFINSNQKHLNRPFIHDCGDTRFTDMPPNYSAKLDEWDTTIRNERERYDTETKFNEPQAGIASLGQVEKQAIQKSLDALLKSFANMTGEQGPRRRQPTRVAAKNRRRRGKTKRQ